MKENKGVEKAKEKLEEISNDEVMQKIADWKESYYREQASIRTTGKKEGLEEGLKEGKKEEKLSELWHNKNIVEMFLLCYFSIIIKVY